MLLAQGNQKKFDGGVLSQTLKAPELFFQDCKGVTRRVRYCSCKKLPPQLIGRCHAMCKKVRLKKRFVVGLMQLALHATRDSPNTSRRFARLVQAMSVCLVGENPTCSVPALQGCEGLWSYEYGHA